jgi:uncharacterized protein
MRLKTFCVILAVLAATLTLSAPAFPASDVTVPIFRDKVYPKPVASFKDLRLRQVVRQTADYSCGAATLATILHYYYGTPVTEREAIIGMFNEGDKEKIQQVGFSMLDMKKFAESRNYQGRGYRITNVNDLKELNIPVIALIETNRYKHFVVIRKVTDQYVFLADPSWGNRRMSLKDFEKVWNQIILAITGPRLATAEGLYAKDYELTLPKYAVIRTEGMLGPRVQMDPTFAFIQNTNIPLAPGTGTIATTTLFNAFSH